MPNAQVDPSHPRNLKLPCSSSRSNKRDYPFLKLVEHIREIDILHIQFEGKIYKPGASIPTEELPPHPVILEYAGKVGPLVTPPHGGQKTRELLWVLWRYDWQRQAWIEITRAQCFGLEYALAFQRPALQAMNPRPELVDITARSQDIAGAFLGKLDETLQGQIQDVKAGVLMQVYDQVAGRIANL